MTKKGYADIVLGLQFGDEGKARVIDNLAKDYDIIARFNGGSNAGHTISQGETKVALNQIPSGIFYPHTTLYIGSGCVVNIEKTVAEINKIKAIGIDLSQRLKISSQASIIQPHHILLDGILGKSVGTTRNGIGPSYADRAMRMYGKRMVNIRLGDFLDNSDDFLMATLTNLEEIIKEYKIKDVNPDELMQSLKIAFDEIKPYIELDPLYMDKRVSGGATVLFEGAQSVMLDVAKGSVPYVTSSNTLAAAAYTGGDLSPKYHRKTIGVVKAIMSRVGFGPFPSEFGGHRSEEYSMERTGEDVSKYDKASEQAYDVEKYIKSDDLFEVGIALRVLSGEYGTVTARPRRVGCFDLVLLAYTIKMNGVDELIITKCDLLKEYSRTKSGKMPMVKEYKLDGKIIDYVPGATSAFYRVEPTIKDYETFTEDISGIRTFEELPTAIKNFVKEVETISNTKVIGLGVGPKRDQYITL
ncbi:MAG TPA: adenylosuccinate synthetase [Patescibacteria group bacterium]|nr:adenylosuccinate synthetase [Patescibacteria group bacterium]